MNVATVLSVLALVSLAAPIASAQTYPSKPIRLIVPYPPGGPNDIFGRLIAQKLSEAYGQQVIIDNRSGASGIIAAELVARAAADGYTLLLGGAALLSMNPALFAKLPYDPVKDFASISLIATAPSMLVTNIALPVKTVQELIALAKAKPGQLNFASAGAGGPPRLAAELFINMTGINMQLIPYNGGGPSLTATLSGEVHVFFPTVSLGLPLVRDGKLRGLAVTSAKRTAIAPDFPTIAESGVPGYEIGNWFAVLAPAATPKAIVARLNSDIVKAIGMNDTRKRLIELGADPIGSAPDELARYTRDEIDKWTKVVKAAGIKLE
jgi:tripartite-type tricarboxylate transporter receptor subunit TctC